MSIRVIAGEFKRRVLSTPPGQLTRPTSARVREALFSILGDVSGLRVLDLYAGSGALGIEALSRGAEHVVFVERGRAALACIRRNLETLKASERATLLAVAVERLASSTLEPPGPFQLVLCDPPWADIESAAETVSQLLPKLGRAVQLVFEHPAGCSPDVSGATKTDERTWGDTGMSLWTTVGADS